MLMSTWDQITSFFEKKQKYWKTNRNLARNGFLAFLTIYFSCSCLHYILGFWQGSGVSMLLWLVFKLEQLVWLQGHHWCGLSILGWWPTRWLQQSKFRASEQHLSMEVIDISSSSCVASSPPIRTNPLIWNLTPVPSWNPTVASHSRVGMEMLFLCLFRFSFVFQPFFKIVIWSHFNINVVVHASAPYFKWCGHFVPLNGLNRS